MLSKQITRCIKTSINIPVCDVESVNSISGIRATIFGGTGFLGHAIAAKLGSISSDMIFPHCHYYLFDDHVKRLRLMGNLGMTYVLNHTNFEDPNILRRSMEHSNVAINCIGPRKKVIHYDKFKEVNIDIPKRLAKQAKKAGVKRFIHFSSLGVDENSPSLDLRTKFVGEQAVLSEFPDATILRLGTSIGLNDHFQRIFRHNANNFVKFLPVFSSLEAKRRPIIDIDVALAVLNAIKLPETAGKTYQVYGPHEYTLKELYEVMMNILNRPMTFPKINRNFALGLSKIISGRYLSHDMLIKEEIDLIPENREDLYHIEDLMVRPASIIPTLKDIMGKYGDPLSYVKDDANL